MEKTGRESKVWTAKKECLARDLEAVARRSPLLEVKSVLDRGSDFLALVVFWLKTLVAPRAGELRTAGPAVVGIRYHESFLSVPPPPGMVTVLEPTDFFHPNSSPARGLCEVLSAAPGMEQILVATYNALVLASYNSIEWQGLDPVAAQFVRSHGARGAFPLLPTGLYEEPPPHLRLERAQAALRALPLPGGLR